MKAVRLLNRYGAVNAGEVAGYEDAIADNLIGRGIAIAFDPNVEDDTEDKSLKEPTQDKMVRAPSKAKKAGGE